MPPKGVATFRGSLRSVLRTPTGPPGSSRKNKKKEMYKQIDLTQIGGFPLTQDALAFMQTSFTDALSALCNKIGNNVVLSGNQFTGGWVTYDNKIIPYEPFTGDDLYLASINQNALFKDGQSKAVYSSLIIKGGIGPNPIRWQDFNHILSLHQIDSQIGLIASNLTDLSNNLQTLTLSHTNLLSAFNNHNHSYNGLLDKPILFQGSVYFGDVVANGTPNDRTINIDIAGSIVGNYIVLGSLWYQGGFQIRNNDVMFTICNKTPTSFQVSFSENNSEAQNLSFDYIIIRG